MLWRGRGGSSDLHFDRRMVSKHFEYFSVWIKCRGHCGGVWRERDTTRYLHETSLAIRMLVDVKFTTCGEIEKKHTL